VDEETEGKKQEELDIGLESLADKYGLDQLKDAMARMTTKE
jgi:benzoyl-CoA reductase subunit BamC